MKEAEQYFNDNLTIEVKIKNQKKEKFYDLVKLNMHFNVKNKTNVT